MKDFSALIRSSDLERIRAGLALPGYDVIKFSCFNRAEADELKAQLSPDERARVHFTWLEPSKPLVDSGTNRREQTNMREPEIG